MSWITHVNLAVSVVALGALAGSAWQRHEAIQARSPAPSVQARPVVRLNAGAAREVSAQSDVAPRHAEPAPLHPAGTLPSPQQQREDRLPEVMAAAAATAQLVTSPRDLEPILSRLEQSARREGHVTAFHLSPGVAAIQAAYRDDSQAEMFTRLADFSRRMTALSEELDPPRGAPQIKQAAPPDLVTATTKEETNQP